MSYCRWSTKYRSVLKRLKQSPFVCINSRFSHELFLHSICASDRHLLNNYQILVYTRRQTLYPWLYEWLIPLLLLLKHHKSLPPMIQIQTLWSHRGILLCWFVQTALHNALHTSDLDYHHKQKRLHVWLPPIILLELEGFCSFVYIPQEIPYFGHIPEAQTVHWLY